VTAPSGAHVGFSSLPLVGQQWVATSGTGVYQAALTVATNLNGERRTATAFADLTVS
jgi:hypothetical protein